MADVGQQVADSVLLAALCRAAVDTAVATDPVELAARPAAGGRLAGGPIRSRSTSSSTSRRVAAAGVGSGRPHARRVAAGARAATVTRTWCGDWSTICCGAGRAPTCSGPISPPAPEWPASCAPRRVARSLRPWRTVDQIAVSCRTGLLWFVDLPEGERMSDVVRASGLVKIYGKVRALDGLDLAVPEATVLAVLGPNGAGKTTAVRILTTLLDADGGTAEVAGFDVRTQAGEVRAHIGVSGPVRRGRRVPDRLREPAHGRPALRARPRALARPARRELLEQFSLDRRRRPSGQDLLRRHAPPPRPRRRAGRRAAGAVPRRADDRPRPAQPHRHVGGDHRAGRSRARPCCSRRSTSKRPTGSPTTSSSSTTASAIAQGTADELKAQVGGERIEVVVGVERGLGAGATRCSSGSPSATVDRRRAHPAADRAGARRCGCADRGAARSSTPPRSPSSTSRCGGRRSTTCS